MSATEELRHMTATDDLRCMLKEHFVTYQDVSPLCTMWWGSNDIFWIATETYEGELDLGTNMSNVSPTQAIYATLGNRHRFNRPKAEEWLRKFQYEHNDLKTVGPDELKALACGLHDDIPFGYEASMRLANWLFCATSDDGADADNEPDVADENDQMPPMPHRPKADDIQAYHDEHPDTGMLEAKKALEQRWSDECFELLIRFYELCRQTPMLNQALGED